MDFTKVDLREINLKGVYLEEANLTKVNLRGANLEGANLEGANLKEAYLEGANLGGANLKEADLEEANLRGTNLRKANLRKANLVKALLPAPQQVLLADWGIVSNGLTLELMRYDAASHPDPQSRFHLWATTGTCPYANVPVERAALFREAADLWIYGPAKRPYDLMVMVLRELCNF
jgi:hypothetical protein